MKHSSLLKISIGVALLLAAAQSSADDIQCKDYWHTNSQWNEMSSRCEEGARNGDPLSQVAVAIHLLDGDDRAGKLRAQVLLLAASAKGYDDAFYWLGASQVDKKKSMFYLEKATGSGGMGLMALAVAADTHFKGDGIAKDFKKARAIYKRAFGAMISNANKGIPKPPGEWWSNAKWFVGQRAVIMYSERYGYQARTVNGKQFLVTVEPHQSSATRSYQSCNGRELAKQNELKKLHLCDAIWPVHWPLGGTLGQA